MASLPYDYRIGLGHGLALGSLTNIEDLLWPYTKPRRLTVRSQPVNAFPVRTVLGSGRERGDGIVPHSWEFTAIPVAAVNYLMTYLWSGGTVVSTAVTIYTRRQELDTYQRLNAYAILPAPGQDLEYLRQKVLRLVIRFSNLEPVV